MLYIYSPTVYPLPGILLPVKDADICSTLNYTPAMGKFNSNYGAGRYANLLFDSTFKVVLCSPENEKLLIEIFELLLPGKHIGSITFINKEMHGLVISEKNTNFDMLCRDDVTGEEFLVEVQNREQNSFRDRVLVYSTYPIREQMEVRAQEIREGYKNAMDYSLKPVYVLSMVNFTLEHESAEAIESDYISRYELRNGNNGELMTGALNFVFLEIGRLQLPPDGSGECRNLLERFVFSMKYMHRMSDIPETFNDPLLDKLFHATELASMSVTERQNYDSAMRTELDRLAENQFAEQRGFAKGKDEGLAEGKAEGRAEGKAEMVKAMLKDGVAAETIARYSGLSPEEIDKLR